jgi:hypothetical protein
MPHSNFRWLSRKEVKRLNFENMTVQQETGYIIECTLSYPKRLHQSQNSFPLAPESLEITQNDLSPYAQGTYL